MEIQFQDLNWSIPKIRKLFDKNPRRSISATFRYLRNNSYLSFFGDYPLLSIIVTTAIALKVVPSKYQITYALNNSTELKSLSKKEKTELLNQLIKPLYVQMKYRKLVTEQTFEGKMDDMSSLPKEWSVYA